VAKLTDALFPISLFKRAKKNTKCMFCKPAAPIDPPLLFYKRDMRRTGMYHHATRSCLMT